MRPRLRLTHRHRLVERQGRVVIDLPGARSRPGAHEPAVAVAGELVQARVGAHDDLVAHLGADRGDSAVEDAVLGPGPGAGLIADGGHPEQVDPPDAGLGGRNRLAAQRVQGVLDDAGHGADRDRLGNALAHEDGQDQLGGAEARLGDQSPQGGCAPQTPGPHDGRRRCRNAPAREYAGGR